MLRLQLAWLHDLRSTPSSWLVDLRSVDGSGEKSCTCGMAGGEQIPMPIVHEDGAVDHCRSVGNVHWCWREELRDQNHEGIMKQPPRIDFCELLRIVFSSMDRC